MLQVFSWLCLQFSYHWYTISFFSAPLPPVMNPAVIQTSARLAGPVTFQPQTQVLPVTTTKSIAIPLDPSTCSKTMTKASKQAKTREESIELAGKFHYASNGKEPGQCESQDLVLKYVIFASFNVILFIYVIFRLQAI